MRILTCLIVSFGFSIAAFAAPQHQLVGTLYSTWSYSSFTNTINQQFDSLEKCKKVGEALLSGHEPIMGNSVATFGKLDCIDLEEGTVENLYNKIW
ncbi:MAG: hypothetical protein AAF202_09640 [Pseudomonadota bacterium]